MISPEQITNARKKLNMSIEELASLCDVTPFVLKEIEDGTSEGSPGVMWFIQDVLRRTLHRPGSEGLKNRAAMVFHAVVQRWGTGFGDDITLLARKAIEVARAIEAESEKP